MGNRDRKPNFGIEALNPENPHNGMLVGKSHCHCASIIMVPACLGDPEMRLCAECMSHCETVWLPLWHKVSRGTYRKNIWNMGNMIKAMEWQELSLSSMPPFEEQVFIAMFLDEDGDHDEKTTDLFTVGRLKALDARGFRFESDFGSDDHVLNETYRKNQKLHPFMPTHFCRIERPAKKFIRPA
jgi:hypothetical protein